MNFRGNILHNIRKQRQDNPGAWLNESLPFDHGLRLPTEYKALMTTLFDECNIAKRRENFINLEILLANLLRHRSRPIAISLSPNHWKKSRYTRAGFSVVRMVKNMHERGFLELRTGYRTHKESRLSRIWATEKLLEYCKAYPRMVCYEPVELVELRDENKQPKDYKDTARTQRIRAILAKANKVNTSAEIFSGDWQLKPFLVAIFDRKFTLYGRLHTRGYRHLQGLSEDERREITINGDPVVELDYKGLHPSLLYAAEGIQFRGDPYSIVDSRRTVRPFLKIILLTLLNAKDEIEAEKAANHWLLNRTREEWVTFRKLGITRAKPLMEKFREAHAPIAHYFCTGKETGLRLMNKDSTIALDVVDHFIKQNIPCLPVHDSFIVQANYRDELEQVMKSTYRRHTGFRIAVK